MQASVGIMESFTHTPGSLELESFRETVFLELVFVNLSYNKNMVIWY